MLQREYTEDCVFNETLEQHNYNTYSSVRWSTPRKTLYLGLNRHGQPRRVQARGHNLGRLSAYARVLTQVAPSDRVEALQNRMLGAHHGVRHHHHHKNLQQTVCPTVSPQEKDGRDRFRCRKRKKRKKRKRRCEEGEQPNVHCEVYQTGHGTNAEITGEGPPASKRSCEDAASDEFCRRQALDAPSKKRKSRIDVGGKKEDNYQPRRKDGKKKNGKKSASSPDASEVARKTTMIGAKRREQVSPRSNPGKKKIPNRSTRTTLPVLLNNPNESINSGQTTPATIMVSRHQKLAASPKNAVTSSVKIELSRTGKVLSLEELSADLVTTTSVADFPEDSSLSSPFQVSEEPLLSGFTDDLSSEVSGEDLGEDDEQTTMSVDYSTVMTTMDTTSPERTQDYTKATTPTVLESLEGRRRLDDDADASGILERFSIGRLAM